MVLAPQIPFSADTSEVDLIPVPPVDSSLYNVFRILAATLGNSIPRLDLGSDMIGSTYSECLMSSMPLEPPVLPIVSRREVMFLRRSGLTATYKGVSIWLYMTLHRNTLLCIGPTETFDAANVLVYSSPYKMTR